VSARASGAATLTEIGGGSRERILDGALELVSRYGISGMSLQLLADHVGLHKSTLFHHFRDKQSLVEEVTRRLMATLAERLRPLAEADPPEIEQVVTIAEALDDYFARRFPEAAVSLKKVLEAFPDDKTARRYFENAARYMVQGVEDDWSGVEKMTEK